MKTSSTRMVFSNPAYIGLAAGIFAGFFLLFSILDEHLFLSPILIFHVPPDGVPNFLLSTAISILLAFVISTNVYVFGRSKTGMRNASWMSGSFVAAATGLCGCTSLGFTVISTFGGAGILASSFLTNYQLPLKAVSLAILFAAYYSARKNMIRTCTSGRDSTS